MRSIFIKLDITNRTPPSKIDEKFVFISGREIPSMFTNLDPIKVVIFSYNVQNIENK